MPPLIFLGLLISMSACLPVSAFRLSSEDSIPSVLTDLALNPLHPLQKRAPNIVVNDCPANTFFHRSTCTRALGPRAYTLYCSLNPVLNNDYQGYNTPTPYPDLCPEDYICANGLPTYAQQYGLVNTAYCVNTENYVKLIQHSLGVTTPGAITATYHDPGSGGAGAVDAVLTDLNGTAGGCVNASSLAIVPQASHVLGSVTSWASVPGGEVCADCASAGIANVSAAASRIDIKVSLEPGVTSALLYLAVVFSN